MEHCYARHTPDIEPCQYILLPKIIVLLTYNKQKPYFPAQLSNSLSETRPSAADRGLFFQEFRGYPARNVISVKVL